MKKLLTLAVLVSLCVGQAEAAMGGLKHYKKVDRKAVEKTIRQLKKEAAQLSRAGEVQKAIMKLNELALKKRMMKVYKK